MKKKDNATDRDYKKEVDKKKKRRNIENERKKML